MIKVGKKRTLSICVSDIPKERILKHENGKLYLNIETWDYDESDKYDNDFSVSISRNKTEVEQIKNGAKLDRIFLGNGRVWESIDKTKPLTQEEIETSDIPF